MGGNRKPCEEVGTGHRIETMEARARVGATEKEGGG